MFQDFKMVGDRPVPIQVKEYVQRLIIKGGLHADQKLRRKLFVAGLNAIGLACHEPEGAFYAFSSIASTDMSSEQFALRLLEEAKVAVVPGHVFGSSGEGFIRCSYAASLVDLEKALERMESFMKRYNYLKCL